MLKRAVTDDARARPLGQAERDGGQPDDEEEAWMYERGERQEGQGVMNVRSGSMSG